MAAMPRGLLHRFRGGRKALITNEMQIDGTVNKNYKL